MAAIIATVAAVATIGAAVVKGVSGYKDKKKAKNKQKAAEAALKDAQNGLKGVDTSNPFEDAKNAYAGLDNKMAGLDNVYDDATNAYDGAENVYDGQKNVYDGQKNVYEGMENKMKGQKNAFDGMENKFEGMENAFEDLTVNTQQAEFEAQQNQQNQANIMSSMAGAAGGSGIAALAQAMANQGSLQSQKASASIGAQEADNAKKAAGAQQDISMATAQEGSRIGMAQAGEQSRLDTQERSADMEIQRTQMGAEEAMQSASLGEMSRMQSASLGEASRMQSDRLGEETNMQNLRLGESSKLQMAEATEAAKLQENEAMGEMSVQQMKGDGALASAGLEMQKQQTLMSSAMQQSGQAASEKQAGDDKMWSGVTGAIGGLAGFGGSDRRIKENIIKIKYSDSGIPIYHFNYIGGKTTWTGTMAQDLIKLGREDAVGTFTNGYYGVNYNLIDVDMKKVKPSPLKQLGKTPQEEMAKQKDMTNAGLDILSGGKAKQGWDELQRDIKNIEPESMKLRKLKDQLLRDKERKGYEVKETIVLPPAYAKGGFVLIKDYKKELEKALLEEDEVAKGLVKSKLANLAQTVKVVKDNIQEFYEDQFESETMLSKGVSQQQVSFATQMYCQNTELKVIYAVEQDVLSGYTDYYGELVSDGGQYCVVEDFYGNTVMLNVIDGNKDMFIRNNLKATEYINFLNETFKEAQEANASKAAVKIDLGRIEYKIDTLFGYNDGTASQEQNELVLMFCHDSEVLRDGSTFRRHLYEHPNIGNLNYGGFDWDKLEFALPLGPGDKNHWADNITEDDKLRLVDAIINVDNQFFNLNLLRTLVKEYYTYKIENTWWKGMGYPEGKLDIMRLKQNELAKARFKKEKAEASKNGMLKFKFDGKVYPTGMTPAKVKTQEKERAEAANPQLKK